MLSVAMVDGKLDGRVGDLSESEVDVTEVLGQGSARAGNDNNPGLNNDGDSLGDLEDLV